MEGRHRPAVSRKYHPNTIWGGYSDYYGFGTDEFMELCRQLGAEPMIVLAATGTDPAQVEDAIEWVHYLVDPPTTEWGSSRAENGHPEPYRVPYIQIDNEPMNHGLTPDQYAEIVNRLRPPAAEDRPQSRIVACGQKRSNDMNWSEKLIDLAGRELRHPRLPQLRVRDRELRDRRAADRGLPGKAARVCARSAILESRSRCSSGALPHLRLAGRASTRRAA